MSGDPCEVIDARPWLTDLGHEVLAGRPVHVVPAVGVPVATPQQLAAIAAQHPTAQQAANDQERNAA